MAEANALAPDPNTPPPSDPPADPPQDPPADPPAGDAPPADPPEGTDPPADPKPKKNTAEDRIAELVAERNATREFGEYWRQRYLQDIQPQQPAPKADEPKPAPKLSDFGFDAEQWATAYAAWADERATRAAETAAEKAVTKAGAAQAEQAARAQWNQRFSAYAKDHPDAIVATQNPHLPINETMTKVIMASEAGPAIYHHLGNNPAEAARISRMPPEQAAAALGRLEATLSAPPSPPPKKPSSAPEPPNPVKGKGAAPGVNLETCSLDDFLKARGYKGGKR